MFVLFVLLLFPFVWVLEMLIGSAGTTRGLPIFISSRELAYETGNDGDDDVIRSILQVKPLS